MCGQWVASKKYFEWVERHDEHAASEDPGGHAAQVVSDSKAGKLCPECGCFLIRYRAGSDLKFHLDHCGRCGGVWFDQAEWDVLRQRGLHRHVHAIFTEARQAQIRRAEHEAAEQARMRKRLGDDTYDRMIEIRQWIDTHPHRAELYAFLLHHHAAATAAGQPQHDARLP